MKLNKTLMMTALVAGGLLAGNYALQAQDTSTNTPPATSTPPAGGMRAPNFDRIAKQLDLTDDQKTKAKPIFDDMIQQMKDLRADTTIAPTDKREKMKEIRTATADKLKDILTPDQLAKFKKALTGNRRPPGTTPPPADGSTPPATTTPPPAQ